MCTLEYQNQWKWKFLSHVWLFATPWTVHGILQARIMEWVGSLSLLQGIFPTQWSNPGLLHCSQILYQMSHKGSPRILEWVAYPCFIGSSQTRNRTGVSCIAGRFFTNWAIRVSAVCQIWEWQSDGNTRWVIGLFNVWPCQNINCDWISFYSVFW